MDKLTNAEPRAGYTALEPEIASVRLSAPFLPSAVTRLAAGTSVWLDGDIYTARDAAHKRLVEMLENNVPLPFDIKDQAIFYAGPCPTPPGRVIGSVGPTTSGRMDAYTPWLLEAGLRVMIGKGARGADVVEAIKKYGAVYLAAVGGTAALLARCVVRNEPVAFEDLGTEAVRRLTVRNMPLTVAVDSWGNTALR